MRKLYIATAIFAFLAALLTQLPARIAWQWWAEDAASNEIFVSNIKGAAFEGSASEIYAGGLFLKTPQWQAKYWPLLIAQIRSRLHASLDGYPFVTDVQFNPTGTISFRNLEAASSLSTLAPVLQLPFMPLKGLLVTNLEKLRLADNRINHITGEAVIKNAEWIVMRPSLPLGNLKATISTSDDLITAQLSSEGQLLIKGTATLNPEGHYEADIQLRSNSGADPRLDKLLQSLGQAVDGWYRIKTQGQLPG